MKCLLNGKCRTENIQMCLVNREQLKKGLFLSFRKRNLKQTGIVTINNHLETKNIHKAPQCQPTCANIKRTSNESINPKWEILRQAAPSSNISKRYLLCLHEKLAVSFYPEPDELLNIRTEMISLLMNFNSNDWVL